MVVLGVNFTRFTRDGLYSYEIQIKIKDLSGKALIAGRVGICVDLIKFDTHSKRTIAATALVFLSHAGTFYPSSRGLYSDRTYATDAALVQGKLFKRSPRDRE